MPMNDSSSDTPHIAETKKPYEKPSFRYEKGVRNLRPYLRQDHVNPTEL